MTQRNEKTARIESIDVLRGITILVMLFVNDIAGVNGLPSWMKHAGADTDAMTFVDVVFPAFLFIVGMSLPYAVSRRLQKGETCRQIWKHTLIRSGGLLIIGILMVNSETISDQGILSPQIWILLMYLSVIFIWNQPSPGRDKPMTLQRIAGIFMLISLVFMYRGNDTGGILQLRTQWWGILGLIGWAYLVAFAVYLPLRGNPGGLVGVMGLLYCVFLADGAGFFAPLTWIHSWMNIGAVLGSHSAIVLSGVILSEIFRLDAAETSPMIRIRRAILYGAGLAAAGLMLHALHEAHPVFIISKIHATPPWCLLSSAFTVWVWSVISILIDRLQWKRGFIIVTPAGKNPLFAYILAPMVYSFLALLASVLGIKNLYAELGNQFFAGFLRAVIFAFGITWLAGGLHRAGLRLKL